MTGRAPSQRVILVVDDDPLLNSVTVNIFEDAGFVALAAADADEAMAILESRSDIALLLTDINMPGSIDGLALAHEVRKRWPSIKIVIVSSRVPESVLPAGSRFFRKPYYAETIISEIRSLIDPASVIRDRGEPIYRRA